MTSGKSNLSYLVWLLWTLNPKLSWTTLLCDTWSLIKHLRWYCSCTPWNYVLLVMSSGLTASWGGLDYHAIINVWWYTLYPHGQQKHQVNTARIQFKGQDLSSEVYIDGTFCRFSLAYQTPVCQKCWCVGHLPSTTDPSHAILCCTWLWML